ncbi:hypothetical protein [Corynebacterium macclintockiae]|uniref:hypothetical protein n=1 Tax=Corynebacterium macclintockiae TaxID=2913501 RepID=UPI003EB86DD8
MHPNRKSDSIPKIFGLSLPGDASSLKCVRFDTARKLRHGERCGTANAAARRTLRHGANAAARRALRRSA